MFKASIANRMQDTIEYMSSVESNDAWEGAGAKLRLYAVCGIGCDPTLHATN